MYRGNYFSSRSVGRSGLARRLQNRLPVIIDQPKGVSRKNRRSKKFRAIFPQKPKIRRNGRALTVSAFVCAPSNARTLGGAGCSPDFSAVIPPTFRRALGKFFVGYSTDFSPGARQIFRRYSPVFSPGVRRIFRRLFDRLFAGFRLLRGGVPFEINR